MTGSTQRPLTARSVLASTLLGTEPPRLPVSFLVRTGALFGLAEGTVRTALSRMVAAGEASTDGNGWYELRGELVERQARQLASRNPVTLEWSGHWIMAVVPTGARPAAERADLRRSMQRRRLAELREGVWLRPDNLAAPTADDGSSGVCEWFSGSPLGADDAALAARLWDLRAWSTTAGELRRELHRVGGLLEAGSTEALAPGFVLSARVLRHFVADPLLPSELLPRDWPGAALRADYERYDEVYRRLLGTWTRVPGDGGPAASVEP
jgi:phenylacetic acid degradation operon negative regulatory protein